jgi:hypothetical protein
VTDESGATSTRLRVAKTAFKRSEHALTAAVITVGTSSAGFLKHRYGISSDKLIRVHNGIEMPTVSNLRRPRTGPRTVNQPEAVTPYLGTWIRGRRSD